MSNHTDLRRDVSTRFASLPLTWSHPMMVGAFYGGLVSLVRSCHHTGTDLVLGCWLGAFNPWVWWPPRQRGLASHIITNARPGRR